MRQKLLPIFLAEAGRNLKILKRYLLQGEVLIGDPDELEDAFRAAHTMKGTAQLVEAQAIYRIARRLEALLEKHVSAASAPTPVECEAMQLAIDWLYQLLDALRENEPESKTLVEDALQALDLAERYPGSTRLIELMKSVSDQRAPDLSDPFADDADFLPEADPSPESTDPFADDPDFGLELDVVSGTFGSPAADFKEITVEEPEAEIEDPFADDPLVEGAAEAHSVEGVPDLFGEDPDLSPVPLPDKLPENLFDPFAGDPGMLEDDDRELSLWSDEHNQAAKDTTSRDAEEDPAAVAEVEEIQLEAAVEVASPERVVDDPFADDPTLEMAIEDEFLSSTGESLTEDLPQAEPDSPAELPGPDPQELVTSLLLGRDAEQPRRDYVACAFQLCGRDYYLPIEQMLEIAELPQILTLPLAPPLVAGLINLRGQVMPVIDLSVLHPGGSQGSAVRRLVVSEYRGEQAAFLAEGIPYLSEERQGEKIDLAVFLAEHRISGVDK